MRGSVAGSISVLLVLALVVPTVAGLASPTLPLTDGAVPDPAPAARLTEPQAAQDPYGWMNGLPLPQLETAAKAYATPAMADFLPAPDTFPGYSLASEAERRDGWHAWVFATDFAKANAPGDLDLPASWQDQPSSEAAPGGVHDALGEPRGLSGLWSLEAHGTPREVVSLDDNGAHALITSRGAIRFEAPGAAPTWMVKPGASIGNVHTTDADGDGVQDIAMTNYAWYSVDAPSFVLISGATGAVLFQGFAGQERLLTWTLTDTDGDGNDELLGITAAEELIAAKLDGSVLWTAELLELPTITEGGLLFYIYLMYDRLGWSMYGDADGDGVLDAFVGSSHWMLLYAFPVLGESGRIQYASAYSGTDGARLWTMPLPGGTSSSYYASTATGDLDGDGSDDVLLRGSTYVRGPVPLVSLTLLSTANVVLSGSDGTMLIRDTFDYVIACVVIICQIQPLSETLYSGYRFIDLDGDGKEELLAFASAASPDGIALSVTARGMGPVPGAPSSELYTLDLGTSGGSTSVLSATLAPGETDAAQALWLLVADVQYTEDYMHVKDVSTRLVRLTADGADGFETARLLGAWDVDPSSGTPYGWIVDDDIWAPVDAEGRNIGPGLRLVLSHTPSLIADHNGDGVPDLLLRKSVGFLWADGRSGGLLADVSRPVTHDTGPLVKDAGRDRFLEYDMTSGEYLLIDLKTQQEIWRLTEEQIDDDWLAGVEDMDGDGRVDALLNTGWFYDEENHLRILSMADDTEIADYRMENRYFMTVDALPARPGLELLVTETDYETYVDDLLLLVPGEDAPRWNITLGDGHLYGADHGYLIVNEWGSGSVIELYDGKTGTKVYEHALPADSYISGIEFTFVDADKTPDIVLSYILAEEGSEYATHNVTILDWSRDRVLSSFQLAKDNGDNGYVILSPMVPMQAEMIVYSYAFSSSYLSAEVGDWDGDGLADFAFSEARWPTVRSSGTGEVIALGPSKGWFGYPADLDGDKRNELALISDTGRLRYFAYDAPAVLTAEPDVLHIDAPHIPQVEDDKFFLQREASALPLVSVLGVLALLGAALRRRT